MPLVLYTSFLTRSMPRSSRELWMLVLDLSGLKLGPAGVSLTSAVCVTYVCVSVGLAWQLWMCWCVLLCQQLYKLKFLLALARLHLIATTTVLEILHTSNRLNYICDHTHYVPGKISTV